MSHRFGRHGCVAAGHAATAEAGAEILRQGGNAVDAAIAAITTSFVAEPVLTAAGGGGFMLIAAPHQSPLLLDGFARMPGGSPSPASLKAIPIDFGDHVQTFHIGRASVATPSLPAMLFEAHRRFGRLPLKEAMAPGLDAIRNGIRLNALQASFIRLLEPILTSDPECTALHAPNGRLLAEGESFRNPDLANTLEMLAIDGMDEFYRGDLARAIVAAVAPEGLLRMQDMEQVQVQPRTPLLTRMFDGEFLTNPPPSSGGLLIAFALKLLEQLRPHLDIPAHCWPVAVAGVLREASRLRTRGFDQRIHDEDPSAEFLSKPHIRELALKLAAGQGKADATPEPMNRHGSTTQISILDADGMAVSMTTSNGEGSGIVVPGTGIHLNNMLGEEDINPLGFHALPPGTTLSSMMAPSIFRHHGLPRLILGSGGSNRLRGAIAQVLVRRLLLGESIEQAVHAPRLHNEGDVLDVEPGLVDDTMRDMLIADGWRLREWSRSSVYFGGVHAIAVSDQGEISAAADPRRGGAVAWS